MALALWLVFAAVVAGAQARSQQSGRQELEERYSLRATIGGSTANPVEVSRR